MFVNLDDIRKILEYVDYFIIDIKILEKNRCKEILGGNINRYYQNIELICNYYNHKNILFRIPCSELYTLTENNKIKIIELVSQYKDIEIELFHLHTLGKKKYDSLNLNYAFDTGIQEEEALKGLYEKLIALGCQVTINGI